MKREIVAAARFSRLWCCANRGAFIIVAKINSVWRRDQSLVCAQWHSFYKCKFNIQQIFYYSNCKI